eukprot:TRINITY_DN2378_c0_g1_i4.p2 TRINITY_DN2378_c0_g1~~TRINITY_DN2378_c0_g1_i4.p2  ORF type:complete len:564 (+),score=142.19 TRINITY_DN2378_c0_g1_i4:1856-3547(+)
MVFIVVFAGSVLGFVLHYFDKDPVRSNREFLEVELWDYKPKEVFIPYQVPSIQGPIKLAVSPSQNKFYRGGWWDGSLHENMVFWVKPEIEGVCEEQRGVMNLDDCSVTLIKTKRGTIWRNQNYIKIEHKFNCVLGDETTCFMFFDTARDLEKWYYGLKRASSYKNNIADEEYVTYSRFFEKLSTKIIQGNNPAIDVDWFNIFAHRAFYGYSSDPNFLEEVGKKVQHKFDKIPKPAIVTGLFLKDVYFGPNLPIFSNIELLDINETGRMQFGAHVKYKGGFHIQSEIIAEISVLGNHYSVSSSLTISILSVEGDMYIDWTGPPADGFWYGFDGEPEIELDFNTEVNIGVSNTITNRLTQALNIKKITKFLIGKIKQEIFDAMLLPAMDELPLPKIGKTKFNRVDMVWEQGAEAEYRKLKRQDTKKEDDIETEVKKEDKIVLDESFDDDAVFDAPESNQTIDEIFSPGSSPPTHNEFMKRVVAEEKKNIQKSNSFRIDGNEKVFFKEEVSKPPPGTFNIDDTINPTFDYSSFFGPNTTDGEVVETDDSNFEDMIKGRLGKFSDFL